MAIGDSYHNRPWAPSQDLLQQQTAGAQSLPGLHQQGIQIKEQEQLQERANRPVTPWQQAIMRLMAGEDPASVARDTKGALGAAEQAGAQPSAMTAQAQVPQAPVPGSAVSGMAGGIMSQAAMPPMQGPVQQPNRQPLPAASAFAQERNPPQQEQGLSGVSMQGGAPQWRGRGGITEDTFAGMTGRDYNDYVAGMGHARAAKQQRDYLAELVLANKGKETVANIGAKAKVEVEKSRSDFRDRNLTAIDKRKELERRLKDKEIDERTAHHIADIELGYAKIRDAASQFDRAFSQKDRLAAAELAQKYFATTENALAKVESSLSGLVGMGQEDLVEDLTKKKAFVEEAKKLFEEEYAKARSNAPVSGGASSGSKVSGPAGVTSKMYKNKKSGQTISASPEQFQEAVTKGRIKADEWE